MSNGIYTRETPWGTIDSFECPECGWNETADRVRARGECERCGMPLSENGGQTE